MQERSEVLKRTISAISPVVRFGRVSDISGVAIRATGPLVALGSLCEIRGSVRIYAEVVRVSADGIVLMPFTRAHGLEIGAIVTVMDEGAVAGFGAHIVGRLVNAFGQPYDGTPVHNTVRVPLHGVVSGPLQRDSRSEQLVTGIRAIDCAVPLVIGQRIGVFAGSGVGKTTFIGEILRNVDADYTVLCLVGERGREAESFWSEGIPAQQRPRSTVVAATSDQPAVTRARAVNFALSIAEHFRNTGKHVLFILDSVSRFAMALREIGLSTGEPPTMRGYTPSVFAALPRVVERCGAIKGGGAITAVMTILAESDDVDDLMADTMRSLLDGHIVLSRRLAEQRHFPAVDLLKSVSRLSSCLERESMEALTRELLGDLARLDASRTLLESGLYQEGGNLDLDLAIRRRKSLSAFLQQGTGTCSSLDETRQALEVALK
ncbi:hypothetical protein WJ32_18545 (plasmid) [Burkholderia ubonensis]|uniref:AAA+ ATPase domain-containing protein n=2 Tax=Burkholderia ubonensis TaxID=101571 RepID=A0A103RNT3_9BURK|nr:hypothetical protein WJ32_18545 [Burkholderia ubonensis]KVG71139.1 hypothetical protein WJ33_21265 [Burkholderia ubonensis]